MRFRSRCPLPAAALAATVLASLALTPSPLAAGPEFVPPGALRSARGFCPLKHTSVKARITGPLARVTVTQDFENPFPDPIEAVYTFPLPSDSAVDDMTMRIGDRCIRGSIKARDEARRIYNQARISGQTAGLLDEERPNVFTQAVANITPGAKIEVEISYVETMPFEAGAYNFTFPMVVAPRYMPGAAVGREGGGWSPDTTRVPDASKISPPVAYPGTRAGHDISLEVSIDAGAPIGSVGSSTHEVAIDRPDPQRALVRLYDRETLPNKDFNLKYSLAGERLADALLTHRSGNDGYFTLLLQPPARADSSAIAPKELVFVLDTSGSMSGFPIEKAKEAMRTALDTLNPRDAFNLITFSGDTHILFPAPVPATPENLRVAREFLNSRYGGGGTEMMKAIRAALDPSDGEGRMRVVCFMTDGEVGNDYEIIGEVQKHPNARVFAFGIGNSVNHFLLDNIARYGRGEVEYVGLGDDGSAAARRFAERVRSPLLTDVFIDWGGLPVTDLYPAEIPDVFAAKPVAVAGRYSAPAHGVIRLRGKMGGRDFVREIHVDLPASQPDNDVLATLWARRKVDDLTSQNFRGMQYGAPGADIQQQITKLGIDYRLMTPFTSFVAVEERVVTEGGIPRRVDVPVDMPDGMSYQGVFGYGPATRAQAMAAPAPYGALGALTEQISVTAAATPVQTASSENSRLADASQMEDMTLKGRDLFATLQTVPGVTTSNTGLTGGNATAEAAQLQINGGAAGGRGGGAGGAARPNFTVDGVTDIDTGSASASHWEPAPDKIAKARGKLDPAIQALIQRLHSGAKPAAEENRFVSGKQAYVRITLSSVSADVLAQLKQAGFTVARQEGKQVTGHIQVDKLEELSQLPIIVFIAPR